VKISFITTIYNEEGTIEKFIDSLLSQTKLPDEVIIADGGSLDKTISKIEVYDLKFNNKKVHFKLLVKKGNRAIGRNEAIKHATGDIIACTDAGNVLDKNWIKKITEPFVNTKINVVAGYYKGLADTVFQKCLLPYVLVMPDRVDPNNFLPATRSVAFTKKIWETVGGFDEKLSHNEDYAFAKKLEKCSARIFFKKDAIVYWIPRNNFKEAFIMFFRFAYGDAEAGIYRPKVLLLFVRYLVGLLLLISAIIMQSVVLLSCLVILISIYAYWSVAKNYKYVEEWQAFYLLPSLQLVADIAVLQGTVFGVVRKYPY